MRRSIEVSFLRPEVLRFVLNSNRWTVSFIRYKKTDQYHIEGMPQYKVQITKVMEYNVEDTPEDETHEVTVSFERFLTCHTEVKVKSYQISPECTLELPYSKKFPREPNFAVVVCTSIALVI